MNANHCSFLITTPTEKKVWVESNGQRDRQGQLFHCLSHQATRLVPLRFSQTGMRNSGCG